MTKTVSLRRLVDVIDCAHVTAPFVDDDRRFPVASIRECQGAYVDLSDCKYTTQDFFDHLRASDRAPRTGDLLFIRNVSVGLVSAVAPGTPEFAVGQETVLLRRTSDVNPRFLRYALVGAEAKHTIESAMIGSTFRRINVSAIRALPVALPPLEEQQLIANYLDRETAHIDTLIEEQQRLIEMLRERRQAVIEHATATGGATPPSEWRTTTLRRIGRFVTGTTPSGEPDEVFDPDGRLAWARPEDLGGRVVPSRRLSASGAMQVRPTRDAVLVCCIGATVGKVGWADGLIASNQQITAVEVDGLTKYWYYALTGSRSALVALAVGNTIPILNNVRLAELQVAVPPMEEQRRLVAYLDDQTGKIDTLIAETQRFIELSKERRAALITAAVTGQIDVREAA